MNCLMQWATIASPIVGVIAIIVSLCISRKSSQDAQRQINEIRNLLDVLVAVHNFNISEAQQKYQKELDAVNREIEQISNASPERKILSIDYHMQANKQRENELLDKRKKLEHILSSINNYIKKQQNSIWN